MTDTAFYKCFAAIIQVMENIWRDIFSISFFGSGFTFGDLFLALIVVNLGLYFLNYFANNGSNHVDDSSKGVNYK